MDPKVLLKQLTDTLFAHLEGILGGHPLLTSVLETFKDGIETAEGAAVDAAVAEIKQLLGL